MVLLREGGMTQPRLFAERRLQVAKHEAALGPINGRASHPGAPRDLLVAGTGVRSQQNLRALELAREPSGRSGGALVIRISRSVSSIRVRRISSMIVSTRMVASIAFRPRQSRPSGGCYQRRDFHLNQRIKFRGHFEGSF